MRFLFGVLTLALSLPLPAADLSSDYQRLQKWRFAAQPVAITAPLTIARDVATITLASGNVRLMEPTSSGQITGLVFEGDGRFTMSVPDPVERAQLRRFTRSPGIAGFEQRFTELVLRISDDTIDKLFPGAAKGPFQPSP